MWWWCYPIPSEGWGREGTRCNVSPPQRGGAVPAPLSERWAEMARHCPEWPDHPYQCRVGARAKGVRPHPKHNLCCPAVGSFGQTLGNVWANLRYLPKSVKYLSKLALCLGEIKILYLLRDPRTCREVMGSVFYT